MFDLSTSKLLILGIVALIVVGPKDLPILLRTLGKYIGMIKRQAAEFRAQFDDAMRESELQQMRKDVESLGQETEKAVREGEQAFTSEYTAAQRDVDQAVAGNGAIPAADVPTADVTASAADSLPPPEHQPSPAEVAAMVASPKSGA